MYSRSFFLRGGYGSSHHPNHWARLFFGWLVVSMVQFKWVNFSRLASGLRRSAWGQMKTDGCVLNPVWMYKSGSIRYWTREETRRRGAKIKIRQISSNFGSWRKSNKALTLFSTFFLLIEPHQIHLWKRCPKII